jgi:hypothetical protein
MANEKELALETLIRGLQQEADMEVDVWREVGNAIMAYTHSKKALRQKLMAAVEKLDGPSAPRPQPLQGQSIPQQRPAGIPPDYGYNPNYAPSPQNYTSPPPNYAQTGQFPANSAQPAWPPQDAPQIPQGKGSRAQAPNGGPNSGNGSYSLGDALRNASQNLQQTFRG